MKDHEYHALTDAFFQYVEDVIDEGYPDIDCERAGGVLTLSFENKTKVIINKQEPLHQIWVATRENGFHFELRGDSWIDNRFGHAEIGLPEDDHRHAVLRTDDIVAEFSLGRCVREDLIGLRPGRQSACACTSSAKTGKRSNNN